MYWRQAGKNALFQNNMGAFKEIPLISERPTSSPLSLSQTTDSQIPQCNLYHKEARVCVLIYIQREHEREESGKRYTSEELSSALKW